jgi:D-3-phosphoglycerate dehydrogenase
VSERLRILAVGDRYVTAGAFRRCLDAALGDQHEIDVAEVGGDDWVPQTESERRLSEYAGSPADVLDHLPGHDVLVIHGAPVSDAVLATPGLRLVCCARGGPVNVDLDSARARGIPVTTTPGKNAQAVVELTLAFLIMLARGVSGAQRFLLDNGKLASTFDGAEFFGVELGGRTLGVVGYGQVGRRVAGSAAALGMRVVAHDPAIGGEGFESGVTPVTLDQLVESSDFVSLHARATPENENMMSAARFAAMRSGGFFVNTARETLVDEGALYDALVSGHLAGAGLDVVRAADDGRNRLLDLPNVVITPHIGGASLETVDRGIQMVADEITRFARGHELRFAR